MCGFQNIYVLHIINMFSSNLYFFSIFKNKILQVLIKIFIYYTNTGKYPPKVKY